MLASLVHVPDVSGEGVPGELLQAERARLLGLPGGPRGWGAHQPGGVTRRAQLHARGRGRRGQGLQHGLDAGRVQAG